MEEKEKKVKTETEKTGEVKQMISKRVKGTKINYSERKKIEMLEDAMQLKKGVIYNLHVSKSDFLIEQKKAKEVK